MQAHADVQHPHCDLQHQDNQGLSTDILLLKHKTIVLADLSAQALQDRPGCLDLRHAPIAGLDSSHSRTIACLEGRTGAQVAWHQEVEDGPEAPAAFRDHCRAKHQPVLCTNPCHPLQSRA